MTTITFLGGPETGDVAYCQWGRFRFDIRIPVECDDPHIVKKARNSRFFRVGETIEAEVVKPDPMAKARAAKAAKKAAVQPPVPFSQTDDVA
jgi:hypothetical protein